MQESGAGMPVNEHEVIEPDPVLLAKMLQESINRIGELFAFKKKINRVVIGLAATTVIDIAITITLVLVFNVLHQAQISACHLSNQTRVKQSVLWRGLIKEFGPAHPGTAQRAKDQKFIAFVDHIFKPVDCEKLYGK